MEYKNTYTRMSEICSLCGFAGVLDNKQLQYEGVFLTGDFSLYDYNHGVLSVYISYTPSDTNGYCVVFNVSTIDDGEWVAYGEKGLTIDQCKNIMSDIISEWKWEYKLPSTEILANFLSNFGLKVYDEC